MQQVCHVCGGDLPAGRGESPFCPHCGTPQLFLAIENQSVETGGEPPLAADGTASTGTAPPPRPQQVEWKMAIRCAAIVSGIASILCLASMRVDQLSPVSFVWIMSASLITLGLYQRKLPAAWIDVRVGARIGVVVGLFLAIGLGAVVAGHGVVARFAMHSMGGFDALVTQQIGDSMKRSQQLLATPLDPRMVALEQTPEFRAVFVLASRVMLGAMLLFVSAVGGAFAGLLRMRRGRVA
ncbi:MAG TPA: hypothetical protein VGU46_10295 [Acidobacteriaceae bacterium]|nr:hypothetical protein [Acidobacteriaceae bacterium]